MIAHSHTYNRANQRNVSDGGVFGAEVINDNIQTTSTVGVDNAGDPSTTQTGTNANLPPYYALCYIIKHTATTANADAGKTYQLKDSKLMVLMLTQIYS